MYDLVASLQPTRRAWLQAARSHFANSGMPTALAMVVVVVGRLDGAARHKVLAAELGISPTTLVRTVDQGEDASLLMRTNLSDDRRGKLVALTAKGRALATQLEGTLSDLRAQLLCDLPVEDIETATRVLRTLHVRARAYGADRETPEAGP